MADKPATDDEVEALRAQIAELEARLTERRKYGLVWDEPRGRADDPYETEAVRDRTEREIPLISEDPSMAVGSGLRPHLLIEGDNYFTLSGLTFSHQGAVDVIYVDPPYNTGREDFLYNDRFVGEDDAYRHSKWLSFMAPRLTLASELLKDEGVIIVSIDDNELAHLRLLMDEIFGENNFIGNVIRATNSTKSNSNFLSVNFDYTLIYAKSRTRLEALIKERGRKWEVEKHNRAAFERTVKKLVDKGLAAEELTEELKELIRYPRFMDMTNYHNVDERGVYQKADLGGVAKGNPTPIMNPRTGELDPVPPGGFRFSEEELERLITEDRIHFHADGSLPRLKRYLADNPKQRPKGIMADDQRPDGNLLAGMGITFDNPKQLAFMKRVLGIFEDDAVILDFFAGSATTGHAVLELNAEDGGMRQFILATDNQAGICRDVAYKRLQLTIDGYTAKKRKGKTEEVSGTGGTLRVFTSDREFIERSDTPDEMRTAFRTACRDLIRLKENCFEPLEREKLFDIFKGEDTVGGERLLAILYGLEGRGTLIGALASHTGDPRVIVYAFSLSSQADPRPFRDAFGGRLELGQIPEQLVRTYERVFARRLYGGWSA